MNLKLKRLFDEDQCDLKEMATNRVERDRLRRKRVLEMVEAEELTEAIDYIHAAIIFQHGESLNDWWQAHILAMEGVKMGFEPKWIAAVALDRWLLRQSLPLKYGNQVTTFGGIYRIPKLDEKTLNQERALWDLPSKEELLAFKNLRGFVNSDIVSAKEVDGLSINVRKLERPPAHSPTLEGEICDYTKEGKPVYQNKYDWKWVNKEDGAFDYGWMLIPYAPVIAHVIAEDDDIFETSEFQKKKGYFSLT